MGYYDNMDFNSWYEEAQRINRDLMKPLGVIVTEPKKRDRSNETFIYISPAHKQKLKKIAERNRRTMRAETELWIDTTVSK